MEDRNSLEYLQSLKNESRNRYIGKPFKPVQAATMQAQKPKSNNNLVSYETLMNLYLVAVQRLNAKGIRPLPHVPSAENELNEVWRCCLLGWASLEYFRQVLSKWERLTGGCDNSPQQEELAF